MDKIKKTDDFSELLIFLMLFIFGIFLGVVIAVVPQDFNRISKISSALLTPTIGILGVWIAVAQWKINQRRLQHELFDRRINLYQIVATHIANAITLGNIEKGKEIEFLRDTKHAIFIFDKEVSDYINEIYKKSIDYQFLTNQQRRLKDRLLEENLEKQQKIFQWFIDELDGLPIRFETFLKL